MKFKYNPYTNLNKDTYKCRYIQIISKNIQENKRVDQENEELTRSEDKLTVASTVRVDH